MKSNRWAVKPVGLLDALPSFRVLRAPSLMRVDPTTRFSARDVLSGLRGAIRRLRPRS